MNQPSPVSQRGAGTDVLQLVVLGFDSPLKAQEAFLAALRLHSERHLALHDAVFVTCDAEGKTSVQETTDETIAQAALGSGFWGLFLGTLLGGPIGGLVGGVLGAGAGAVSAELIDVGIRDATIAEARRIVRPNTANLMLLVSQVKTNVALEELHRFAGAQLVWASLDPAAVAALQRALMTS